MSMKGRTIVISGASRGIGKAIALRCAREGANVAILAKTTTPHPTLPGTIYTAQEECKRLGGDCLAIPCDLRFPEQIESAVHQIYSRFGHIDALINNASAIQLTDTLGTPHKRYDLMQQVCARGTFLLTQACLPYLCKSPCTNPHIITISPPLLLEPKHFKDHLAYTIAKYGMSMCTLGWSAEFKGRIAVNSLWPRTLIATDALRAIDSSGHDDLAKKGRTVDIMMDACEHLLKEPLSFTGNFLIDDSFLHQKGITDFTKYSVVPGTPLEDLTDDLFVPSKL